MHSRVTEWRGVCTRVGTVKVHRTRELSSLQGLPESLDNESREEALAPTSGLIQRWG